MTRINALYQPNRLVGFFGDGQFRLVVKLNRYKLVVDHVDLLSVPFKAEREVLDVLGIVDLFGGHIEEDETLAHVIDIKV